MIQALDRLLFGLDYLTDALTRGVGLSAGAYCDLETADDEHTLATRDGALVSVVAIRGADTMVGAAEHERLMSRVADLLHAYLGAPGHGLQIIAVRDPDGRALVEEALAPARASAGRLELDMAGMLDSYVDTLSRFVARESVMLVVTTMDVGLTGAERRLDNEARREALRESPYGAYAQRAAAGAPALRERHASVRDQIVRDLSGMGLMVEVLDAHGVLWVARHRLDPDQTSPDWRGSLPGDPLPRHHRHPQDDDLSALLWPPVAGQILPRGASIEGLDTVRIGRRLYAPAVVVVPPARTEPFNVLWQRLRHAGIPFAVSMRLVAEGYAQVRHKDALAQLLSFGRASRLVARSLKTVRETMDDGATFLALRIEALTWVDDGSTGDLETCRSRLVRALQGWGGCEVSTLPGNPLAAVTSTVPGVRMGSQAPAAAAPVEDAAGILPLARPGIPWGRGALLLRTPDGKLMPYESYSSLQSAWITLIYAPMGAGKSVLMNAYNLSLCLAAGVESLPLVGIVDIGPSSSGFISLVREALPAGRRHLALYRRLRMRPEDAVNPCDTLLGCRRPLAMQRAFLANLLTLLATPLGQDAPYEGVTGIADMVIGLAFDSCADSGSPKRYDPGTDPEVDEAVARAALHVDEHTTWWEMVDALHGAGDSHGAMLAQRHAVPTLSDLGALARDESVVNVYRGQTPTGERLVDFFWRSLSEAVRMYPVLARPTRLDLGEARIVSLDLEEVAPKGSPQADRQTGVMYMVARQILGWRYMLRTDHLSEIGEGYRALHRREIEAFADTAKRMCFDEAHRVPDAVRAQILLDMREGRKRGVDIVLASQMLRDFDAPMIDIATTVFVLGAGELSLDDTVSTFHLPEAARYALRRLGRPDSSGAGMVGWFKAHGRRFAHLLTLTLPPEWLWAFSTTAEDVAVRDALYRMMPPAQARQILARHYPGGIKRELERRRALMREQGEGISEEGDLGLRQGLVEEIAALRGWGGKGEGG